MNHWREWDDEEFGLGDWWYKGFFVFVGIFIAIIFFFVLRPSSAVSREELPYVEGTIARFTRTETEDYVLTLVDDPVVYTVSGNNSNPELDIASPGDLVRLRVHGNGHHVLTFDLWRFKAPVHTLWEEGTDF